MGHLAALRDVPRSTKQIDDRLWNRLGVQVGRTVAAHAAVRMRRAPEPSDARVAEALASVRRDGFAVLEDFLPADEFDAVARTAFDVAGDPGVAHEAVDDGGAKIHLTWRSDVDAPRRRELDRFFCRPAVADLLGGAERVRALPGSGRCTIQLLTQVSGASDVQADVHSDTFQPTHKLWLYLTDVAVEDGPLVFHPGSHRLTPRSLAGVYRESIGANRGSRVVEPEELAGAPPPRTFACAANTAVIANTHGYHGRIQGHPPGRRAVLTIEMRLHPFRRPAWIGADRSRATGRGHGSDGPTQR